jgi:ankyrin repeat protein
VVEALLAAGADKDAKALGGTTALDIASQNGHLAVVEALRLEIRLL